MEKIAVIKLLTGKVKKSGRLSVRTLARLQMSRLYARRFRKGNVSYLYVITQGRKEGEEGPRPCDAMSAWIRARDTHCTDVITPGKGYDLVDQIDRELFADQVVVAEGADLVVSI